MILRRSIVICFIISHSSLSYENVENQQHNNSTNVIIEDIIQKVTNLTLRNTYNVPAKNKNLVLRKMQKKLGQLAKSLNIDKKYMNILMDGIEAKVSDIFSNDSSDFNVKRDHIATHNNTTLPPNRRSATNEIEENLTKNDIIKKVNILVSKYLTLVTKADDKIDLLRNIKEKILRSTYNAIPNAKFNYIKDKTVKESRRAKMDKTINDAIRILDEWDEIKNQISVTKSVGSNVEDCDKIVEGICLGVKNLRNFTCHNSEVIPLVKLCDSEPDCEDHSDETNCNVNVVEAVETASYLINKINTTVSAKCFSKSAVRSFLSTQATDMIEELETQTEELKQLEIGAFFDTLGDTSNKMVYPDFTTVLSSLSLTIEQAVCMDDAKPPVEPEFSIEEFQDIPDEEFSPKTCLCRNGSCVSANCDNGSPCWRICIQKHILKNWGCLSTNNEMVISLDEVCDGKIDCVDATDEESCSADKHRSRHQAIKFYNTALAMILERTKLKKNKANRNNLYLLHGMVREMQKLVVKPWIDHRIVKKQRDAIFNMIGEIFENTIKRGTVPVVEGTYEFLILINVKLVEAMKLSHIGNVASFSPDSCVCKNGDCTLRRCSKKCIRTCLVEPKLMRYPCGSGNESVALTALCNGINNCVSREDEADCMSDIVCRPHHFIMLRHDLRDIGEKRKGTALGETLITWKLKATGTLQEAEKLQQLSPAIFTEKLHLLLSQLLQAYATMDDHKQHGDYVLKEFEKVAYIIMKAKKLCGK